MAARTSVDSSGLSGIQSSARCREASECPQPALATQGADATPSAGGRTRATFALLGKKLKFASCPARVTAPAWQPMHVPPCVY